MPSPFPGMDPYLEDPFFWPDFHFAMIAAMRAQLNASLPDRYVAAADRNVWIHEPDAEERRRLAGPDDFVTDRGAARCVHAG